MKTRVLVYDDHKGRREALQLLIDATPDMQCVGTVTDCSRVLQDIEDLKPDVVLMDIDMPKVNGIDGLKLIRQQAPNVLILMQTVFEDDEKLFLAIRSGAHGYFLKKTSPVRLIEGIRDALEGGAPMSPLMAKKVFETFQHQQPGLQSNHFALTERELQILSLLMKGMSYKMISEMCQISFNTVNGHCKRIYEKLHVHSATEAVAKAIDHKIL